MADIEEERATQIAAVADGVDPKKEAARIRERHIHDAVSTEGGMGRSASGWTRFAWIVLSLTR